MNVHPQPQPVLAVQPASPCLPAPTQNERRRLTPNRREEAEGYRSVVAVINDGWRVIECRDRIQWIIQRKTGLRHGQPRWDGRSYCTTRECLIRRVRDFAGPVEVSIMAVLDRLPEYLVLQQPKKRT